MSQVTQTAKRIIANIETVIVGKRRQIVLTLASLFCEGHLLLEDVPGVAKTILASSPFREYRLPVQTRPVYARPASDRRHRNVRLQSEDERVRIPRGADLREYRPRRRGQPGHPPPRTQSSLLEAMAESSVSVDGTTYPLEQPFFVIATQNPVDHEGTFALPEAQLDRFFMKFGLGYPSMEEEIKLLAMLRDEHPITRLGAVATTEEILACRKAVREVRVGEKTVHYITSLVHGTREHEDLVLGGSPRASIALYRGSQALAAIQGRDYVLPDDVQQVAQPILSHRLIVRPECRLRKVTAEGVVQEILETTPVPTHREAAGST